jgi:hypothetical protein
MPMNRRAVAMSANANADVDVLWEEDFSKGFLTEGPSARWAFLPFGPGIGRDGLATTTPDGLRLVSGGAHPRTGKPAFTQTVGPHDPGGRPGSLDHVKWLTWANVPASEGGLGFDVAPGEELVCEAWLSGTAYGVAGHPFGSAVADPGGDPRLAVCGMPVQDLLTGAAFSFFLTNRRVYAFYERLPHHREHLGRYGAFLHTVPVATRRPEDEHHLRVAYDRSRGLARWFLDGVLVLSVDRIGRRLPSRRHLVLDHGGTDVPVAPSQLALGLGIFTILDGAAPGRPGSGLVRLDAARGHYRDPASGDGAPQAFIDDASLADNRLWGQGAALRVRRLRVSKAATTSRREPGA